MERIRTAEIIARIAHFGQCDIGGHPYIEHPATVVAMVETEEEKAVAWLHDVVEDTSVTLDALATIFDSVIIEAVDAITRREGEARSAYLNRVLQNSIATRVKLADLAHNMDIDRIENPTEKDRNRIARYQIESEYLKKRSGENESRNHRR